MIASCVFSCKDNNETPSFAKANLIADWNRVSTNMDDDDCDELLEIDEVEVTVTATCEGGSVEYDFPYSYNGKNKVTSTDTDEDYRFVVRELTSTKLKIDWYYSGMKYGTSTYEKL